MRRNVCENTSVWGQFIMMVLSVYQTRLFRSLNNLERNVEECAKHNTYLNIYVENVFILLQKD